MILVSLFNSGGWVKYFEKYLLKLTKILNCTWTLSIKLQSTQWWKVSIQR